MGAAMSKSRKPVRIMSFATIDRHDAVGPFAQAGAHAGGQSLSTSYVEVDGLRFTRAQYEHLKNYKRPDDLTPATDDEIRALFKF